MTSKYFILKSLILLLATLALISNYKHFETSKLQTHFFSKSEPHNQDIISQTKFFYPSLTFNSVPYTTYLSQIYSNNEDYDMAISFLLKSLKSNRNCMYSRYLLSRNYVLQKKYLNAEIILEYLFNLNPNIESTSALYFSVLGEMNKQNKLISLKSVVEKIDNKLIWKYYLAALKRR